MIKMLENVNSVLFQIVLFVVKMEKNARLSFYFCFKIYYIGMQT